MCLIYLSNISTRVLYVFLWFPSSHLSLYDGVKLLETLAERIHLSTSSFINIR